MQFAGIDLFAYTADGLTHEDAECASFLRATDLRTSPTACREFVAVQVSVAAVLLTLVGAVIASMRYCIVFPRQPFDGPLPPLPTGSERPRTAASRRMSRAIASVPHNVAHPRGAGSGRCLYRAADCGASASSRIAQVYEIDGVAVRNIEVVLEPPAADRRYTVLRRSAPTTMPPTTAPAPTTMAPGVAALLELARLLAHRHPRHARLRLVFFVNEEQPYGKTRGDGQLAVRPQARRDRASRSPA